MDAARERLLQDIEQQRNTIKELKAKDTPPDELAAAISRLLEMKKSLGVSREEQLVGNRRSLDDLLRRRYFIGPSFEIYGSVAGLYDYGPPGSAMKSNFVSLWRQHFILEVRIFHALSSSRRTPWRES